MNRDRDWMKDASCRGLEPELFYLPKYPSRAVLLQVTRVCDRCPILAQCARYAVDLGVTSGVWAGERTEHSSGRKRLQLKAYGRVLPEAVGHGGRRDGSGRKPAKCKGCNRALRSRNQKPGDVPGSVRVLSRGRCESCVGREERGERTTFAGTRAVS